MALKFCPFCGFKLASGEAFCPNCGKKLPADAVATLETSPEVKEATPNEAATQPTAEKISPPPTEKNIPPVVDDIQATVGSENKPQKKKHKGLIALISGVIVLGLAAAAVFFFILPKKLSGTYSATIPLLFSDSTDTLTFSNGKVTEKFDGKTSSKGTYKISGEKLTLTLGKSILTARLAQNKKSFTIQTAGGESGLTEGLKYSLETNKGASKKTSVDQGLAMTADAKTTQTVNRKIKGTYTIKKHRVVIATGKNLADIELATDDKKTFEIKQSDLDAWVGTPQVEKPASSKKAATATSSAAEQKDSTTASTTAESQTTSSSAETSESTITDEKVKGTYDLSGDTLTVTVGRYKATIKLSADKKSFEIISTEVQPELKKMNFDQIIKGDYTSLMGDWKLVGTGACYYTMEGPPMRWEKENGAANTEITITKDKIQTDWLSVEGSIFIGNDEIMPVQFINSDGQLTATLSEESSINWAVSFYPGGVSSGLGMSLTNGVVVDESKNRIVFWSSNNQNYSVYEQEGPDLSTQWNGQPLNLDEIRSDNFLSMAGIWVDPKTRKEIIVTSKVIGDPFPEVNTISGNAVILDQPEQNGYPYVIAPLTGDYASGEDYITAGMNSFDPNKDDAGVQYYLIEIIPQGVERQIVGLGTGDASKDRIVYLGNSFSGEEYEVYYRKSELGK